MPAWVMVDVTLYGGDAEVGEDHPVGGEQHVAGLDVAVHDPGGVGVAERVEHPDADLGGLDHGQRPALPYGLLQGPGADQLHHDPGAAVLLDDVVDGDDAGVTEPRRRAGLAQHPLVRHLLARVIHPVGEDQLLDGHIPVEQDVVRMPHHAHSATAHR